MRTFVPTDLDPSDLEQLKPLYQALLDRDLDSVDDVRQWLSDYSELSSVVGEYASRRNIDMACHTDDADIEKAYLHWIETIAPALKPYGFKLQKKLLESGHATELEGERFRLLVREWRSDVELFRDENIPLQTQEKKLVTKYDKTVGAMTIDVRGETYTLPQAAALLEDTDRALRQEVWEKTTGRRLQDRETIESTFGELLTLRQQIARNADLPDYRAYMWKAFGRFDYQPEDCHEFARSIEEVIVPKMADLDRERRSEMGLETLRPWDTSVDVQGRGPLRPFDKKNVQALLDGAGRIFEKMGGDLSETFAKLEPGRNLDLDSRTGKRAGGFQASLSESREPFIFMNAAGLQRDVETILHEAGHAFHYLWASRSQELIFFHHAPIEFCEVASMSMELFADPYLDVFYAADGDADRARRKHLEGVLRVFPWIATIDQFQHWLYTNPGHSPEQRRDAWRGLWNRFMSDVVDYTGYEDALDYAWHRQLHLFHHPFYYVEYGIAQLGALQMWAQYRDDPEQALANYREALTLGGTRALPALFEAAGIRFDFSRATVEPLIETLVAELDKLPA